VVRKRKRAIEKPRLGEKGGVGGENKNWGEQLFVGSTQDPVRKPKPEKNRNCASSRKDHGGRLVFKDPNNMKYVKFQKKKGAQKPALPTLLCGSLQG